MFKKLLFMALCLTLIFVSACVSKKEYVALETKSNQTQAQLEQEIRDLQAQVSKLTTENNRHLDTIEGLKTELEQEKRTVKQKEREVSELDKTRQEIESSLKEQIAQKDIKLEEIEGKLKVTFVDKILFDSGSVMIKPKGQEVLLKLADSFRDSEDQNIAVEGHTDDVQIGTALLDRFPTNWELSTARSTAVVRFLQEKGNIAPERLTASGFSYFRPVATNETPEGRKQNRRIEIILVPVR
ncbi:MAG: OmpA family protein [Desulfobacterales bacterium]|jgi:chemotaxis protein MotB